MTQPAKDAYEKLRTRINALLPERTKLGFGSEYEWGHNGAVMRANDRNPSGEHACRCRANSIVGQAFSDFKCGKCKKKFSHPNTGVPSYCKPCAQSMNKCQYCKAHLRVLGLPLTLAEILRVLPSYISVEFNSVDKTLIVYWDDVNSDEHEIEMPLILPVSAWPEPALNNLLELMK